MGGVETLLLCVLLGLCIPGNQERGYFVLFGGGERSKLSMFRGVT